MKSTIVRTYELSDDLIPYVDQLLQDECRHFGACITSATTYHALGKETLLVVFTKETTDPA